MLQRRSIRSKLIATLVPLLAIFFVLALSGLWGLNRYGHLADAVSQRATEIPFAHELHDLANSIRINDELKEPMVAEPALLEDQRMYERQILRDYVFDDFDDKIKAYRGRFDEQTSMLADRRAHHERLLAIENTFSKLLDARHTLDVSLGTESRAIKDQMDKLILHTKAHLDSLHGEIKEFSKNVRVQYRRSIQMAWACGIFALAMVGLLWWVFRSQVVKPFQTLLGGSRLVAAGQFGHRIDLGTDDELSELAEAMNGMSRQFLDVVERQKAMNAALDDQVQQRTREVIQNEQLASVGFLAAGVAHEINNPLASIAWSAESLERQVDEMSMMNPDPADAEALGAMKTNMRRIQDEAYRCSGITKRLLDFSRLGDVTRSSTNLGELVEDVVEMVRKVGKYRCKTVRTHCQDNVFAHVNAQEIRQVVLNLVTNSLESVDTDGEVDVYVQRRGGTTVVRIVDNGCGMSQEVLEHLFEPFFTRRRDGTGTGLGLSITYRIVSQHHGSLCAHSEGEGRGSKMEMSLPAEACCDDNTDQNHDNHGWIDVSQKVA